MVGILCHIWSRNCLPFWRTLVYAPPVLNVHVLVGLVLFPLSSYMSSRFWFRVVMYATIPLKNDVRFVFTLICFVRGSCFIYVSCIFTYTGVQPNCHIGWCRLTVTRQVSLVEQELLTLPNLSSPSDFSGVRFARSLVFCVMFCRSLFVFLSFSLLCMMYNNM